jgi:hypothetical protein
LRVFVFASDKIEGSASEEAVVVKMQCRTQLTLFWVDKTRMDEINSGNYRVVTVTQIVLNLLVRPILVFWVHNTCQSLRGGHAPRLRDLAGYTFKV